MTFPLVHPATDLAVRSEGDERTRTAASVPTTENDKAPLTRDSSRHGWVYLIDDGGWSYKIGYARDPERRLALLQTGSPEELRLIGVIDAPPSRERELHELFAGDRTRGEWFNKSRELAGYFEDHGWVCICRGRRVDPECFIHGEGHAPW